MKKTILLTVLAGGLVLSTPEMLMAEYVLAAATQTAPIKGVITDNEGEPIIGASVLVKGSKTGVTTGINGEFAINASQGDVLQISFVGYSPQDVVVDGNNLSIVLDANASVLDEVLVIGYGTIRKKDLTGSVSQVKDKDLNTVSSSSVSQMLQGKVSGMSVMQSSAQPGASTSINIRGAVSPRGSNAPLFVIDGVPLQSNSTADPGISGYDYKTGVDRDPLNTINPNDIESIEVLKDASAAAIYGASAANGVILITTKSGKKGKVKVDYRGVYTAQIKKAYPKVMGAKDFREQANFWSKEYYLYSNKMGMYGTNPIDFSGYTPIFANVSDYTSETDWIDEVSRNGYIIDQNVSVNGGTDRTNYFFSYNFYDNQGLLKQSDLIRHNIRLNLDQRFSSRFKAGIKMNYSNVVAHSTSVGAHGNGDNMLVNAFRFAPDIPVYDADGNYSKSYDPILNNPVGFTEIEDKTSTNRVFIAPTLEFKIIDGLVWRAVGGYDNQQSTRKFYIPKSARQENSSTVVNGFGNIGYSKVNNISAETFLNYDKQFGNNHRLSAVLGIGYYRLATESFGMNASNFFTDAFGTDNIGIASDKALMGIRSARTERTKLSQFARVNYTLMDRYIFTVTARRDGSSYFAENNKWGIFPSASVAWRISEESFMRGKTIFNDLKLRVGYGSTGNENVIGSNALTLYTSGYNTLIGNSISTGFMLTQLANPDLKWETDYTLNVGVDFGILNQRINGSIEFFRRGVKDLLDFKTLPFNNVVTRIAANVGETGSNGFELTLNSTNITTKEFNWETSLNVSHFKAYWIKRNPEVGLAEYIGEKDEISQIYGWETAGIIRNEADKPSYMPNANVGNIIYVDQNGDGELDGKDVVKLGRSLPSWFVGFGNTLYWKGFDLNFYFYGSFGNKKGMAIIPDTNQLGNKGSAPRNTYIGVITDVWNSQNGNGWMPGIASNPYDGKNPTLTNDYLLQDASYIKLKNITLGYSLPAHLFGYKTVLHGVRFFIDAQNVATITKFKGFDPELDNTLPYPQALSLSFGVNLNF